MTNQVIILFIKSVFTVYLCYWIVSQLYLQNVQRNMISTMRLPQLAFGLAQPKNSLTLFPDAAAQWKKFLNFPWLFCLTLQQLLNQKQRQVVSSFQFQFNIALKEIAKKINQRLKVSFSQKENAIILDGPSDQTKLGT